MLLLILSALLGVFSFRRILDSSDSRSKRFEVEITVGITSFVGAIILLIQIGGVLLAANAILLSVVLLDISSKYDVVPHESGLLPWASAAMLFIFINIHQTGF